MARTTLHYLNGLDGDLDDAIMRLVDLKGGAPNADLFKDMVHTILGLLDDGTGRGELKIVNTALQELRAAFQVFAPWTERRKVSIFGSARTPTDRPEFAQANAFGSRMAELGYMVITGAGGGVMRAANEGAGRARSFGCMIRLPFEPDPNEVLMDDDKLVTYKYFFTRKLTFVKETDALALFPGGFGTLDECFEVLTLIQTGKSDLLPIVFIDVPGGGYWHSFARHTREQLLPRGLISPEDTHLFKITEDIEEAAQEIVNFYRNYHSTRYVRDLTVIRHQHPLDDDAVEELSREFADLLHSGSIVRSRPLPEEANEPEIAGLERLVLRFKRKGFGRFRCLVDRLNALAPASTPRPAPAAPGS